MSVPPDSTTPEQLIAELQRQLAERTVERDEALARETATAEVLQVINSSPGDLTPVFESILEKAHALCGVAYGSLQLWDGTMFHAVAVHGLPEALASRLREGYVPGPRARRLIDGADFVHIPDVAEIDEPLAGAMIDAGFRTLLTVALRKDGKFLGRISAARREVRPFSDKEISLLQGFAAQAVIAMENARLLGELRQRTDDLTVSLEQQTATAEILRVISQSPTDVSPVLAAVAKAALKFCGALDALVILRDGDNWLTVAHEGPITSFGGARPLTRGSGPGRAILDSKVVQIADVQSADGDEFPEARARGARSGWRSLLAAPLLRDHVAIGAISIRRAEAGMFTPNQIELLKSFAAQAVIAMENARLLTETREALEQQTATAEILRLISGVPADPQPVFEMIVRRAVTLCGSLFANVFRFDGDLIHFVASHIVGPSYVDLLRATYPMRPDQSQVSGRVLLTRSVVHVDDALADRDYDQRFPRSMGWRRMLGVPILGEGAVLGVIVVGWADAGPVAKAQEELLKTFADQAVIAIENARLFNELRERNEEIAGWNRDLEARVAEQVEELGRVSRLKRFLAPQLAELIVSRGDEKILESHRREIVVVFCDLRGYTAFTETAEPEEVLDFLREYHGALGPLVSRFEGTLDQFSGDGIMVFFNDPLPIPDPAERAVKMAIAMREAASTLIAAWRERGRMLGFGAGIAQGYATLGQIGFSERSGYTAIGTVCNVAARLCGEAKDGQLLLSQRVNVALKGSVATEQVGALTLKGLTQPIITYNVPLVASQPALRVIDGGNH